MHLMFSYIPVMPCGKSPELGNATYVPIYGLFGDSITYTCLPGYWITLDMYSISSNCEISESETVMWSTIPNQCTCEYVII